MKRLSALTLLLTVLSTACGAAVTPVPTATHLPQILTIFAASSLTGAYTELGAAFDAANPGLTTNFNFSASEILRTQIEEGAPADVFASASGEELNVLIIDGLVKKGVPQTFLTNELVVIMPADNPAALEKPEDLARPGIKLVLAAETVPVGNYARQALDKMNGSFGSDFKGRVLANVVSYEENVRQVVAKVQLGEADAGIVYVSDGVAAPELQRIEIPADLNITAKYAIGPLSGSVNSYLAEKFVEYVLSAEGQAILQKWGFTPIQ